MLIALAALFFKLSLLAIGGVNSTLPAIAREVLTLRHWLTPKQFAQLFAIAQAAPGPNMLIVTLIGMHEAGIAGGLVATAAMIMPSGILVMAVSKFWDRHGQAKWRRIVQAALLPITAGLVLAAACVLIKQADDSAVTVIVTAIAAFLSWGTRLHPLWLLAGGTVVGLVLS